jgi:hypothetical protein
MLEKINLKGDRFILAHGFRPWYAGSVAFGPVVRQYIMVGAPGAAELLTS